MSGHVERAIGRYFAGGIETESERAELFTHLEDCAACRAAFEAQAAADRALSGRAFAPTQLASMLPALLDEAAREAAPTRTPWLSWARWAAVPALALGALVVVGLRIGGGGVPADDGLTPKGGAAAVGPLVEALCFDADMRESGRHTASGTCPAPGFVKLAYLRPTPVPLVTVVVLDGAGEVRLHAELRQPRRLDLADGYATLAPGDVLRVIAVESTAPLAEGVAKSSEPVLTLRAAP